MTVLYIGVGATKSGTSWLHRELGRHPDVYFRGIKELHYFDTFDFGVNFFVDARKRRREQLMQEMQVSPTRFRQRQLKDIDELARVMEIGRVDAEAYLAYLGKGMGSERVFGETTPGYNMLSKERLAQMANLTDDVRIVYLMRDPVERLWSHVRMQVKRESDKGDVLPATAWSMLEDAITGQERRITDRGEYASALAKLMEAIPAEKRYIGFFEDVVLGSGFADVCRFLGLDPIVPERTARNEGKPLEMRSDLRQKAREYLAPQYDAVERHMGYLPEAWKMRNAA